MKNDKEKIKKLTVKVIPKSSKNEVITEPDGSLKVKLTAAPEKGKANAALIKLLAEELGVSSTAIKIIKGARQKLKLISIGGK